MFLDKLATRMELEPGTRIGPYEIAERLGAGGMGVVYRAHDARLQRDVAIKLAAATLSGDSTRTRQMQQEARAASKLNHPNVVAVFDVGAHEGRTYVVTELLEGESLRAIVERGATPWRTAVEIALQIAEGLSAAHEQGLVHRDVKPDNVFRTRNGRIKILDFGIATWRPPDDLTSGTAPTMSQSGLVVGTVGYMSPEQARGEKVDARSDLFAFGALLYELLSGEEAFTGRSAIEVLTAIQRDAPVPLESRVADLPVDLVRIVDRCLEKEPSRRFQSARDLVFALTMIDVSRTRKTGDAARTTEARPATKSSRRAFLAIGAALVADSALTAVAYRTFSKPRGASNVAAAAASSSPPNAPALFRPVTFRRGTVWTARFTRDGASVVYSASWKGTRAICT